MFLRKVRPFTFIDSYDIAMFSQHLNYWSLKKGSYVRVKSIPPQWSQLTRSTRGLGQRQRKHKGKLWMGLKDETYLYGWVVNKLSFEKSTPYLMVWLKRRPKIETVSINGTDALILIFLTLLLPPFVPLFYSPD